LLLPIRVNFISKVSRKRCEQIVHFADMQLLANAATSNGHPPNLQASGTRLIITPHVLGFLLDTGCRLSELIRVRPDCLLDDGLLFKDRQNGGKLKVPLTPRARVAITSLHRDPWWQHWTRSTNDSNKELRDKALENLRTRLSQEFTSIRNDADISGVSLHTCRRTGGSRLAQAGVAMHIIQGMLGHEDIGTTSKRYAHLAPNSLLSTFSVLERQESNNVVPIDRQRIKED
jgi:integrase